MRSASLRILVVDDHDGIRAELRRVISAWYPDAEILEAADGPTAVAMAAGGQPHVVIMDIGLPGMNGIEATHAIQAAGATKVVMLSLHDDERFRRAALEAGACACLSKAQPFSDLRVVLDGLIGP